MNEETKTCLEELETIDPETAALLKSVREQLGKFLAINIPTPESIAKIGDKDEGKGP